MFKIKLYEHKLLKIIIGTNAEALSKMIVELGLSTNLHHISYLGRELKKA